MNVVIQCAAGKHSDAGHLRTTADQPVMFVADPAQAPHGTNLKYARPNDLADDGRTWREHLIEYNRASQSNPLKLRRAFELYKNPAYGRLASRFGVDKLFVLSAGWGLIPATFLTPAYDITFSQRADDYKRRRKSDKPQDLNLLPVDSDEPMVFLGGLDYLPLFARLTRGANGRRVVFYNSMNRPDVPGCVLKKYETAKRTNWHYECANALAEGNLELPD